MVLGAVRRWRFQFCILWFSLYGSITEIWTRKNLLIYKLTLIMKVSYTIGDEKQFSNCTFLLQGTLSFLCIGFLLVLSSLLGKWQPETVWINHDVFSVDRSKMWAKHLYQKTVAKLEFKNWIERKLFLVISKTIVTSFRQSIKFLVYFVTQVFYMNVKVLIN